MRFLASILGVIAELLLAGGLNAQTGAPLKTYQVGSGSVIRSPDKPLYQIGETVTLTVVPARYYAFSGWSDGVQEETRVVVAGGNDTYGARFTNTIPVETLVSKDTDVSIYGPEVYEGGSYLAFATTAPTTDHGFILAGYLSGYGLTNYLNTTPGFGGYDFWIGRFAPEGNLLWSGRFGGTDQDTLVQAQETSDGGFLLVGSSASPPGGNKTAPLISRYDFWIVKLGRDGQLRWDRDLLSTGGDLGYRFLSFVKETPDGGFILGGDATVGFDDSLGSWNLWLERIDSNGTLVWRRSYGGNGTERTSGVVLEDPVILPTPDGGWVIALESDSQPSGNKTAPSYGDMDYWVVRIDANGQKLWDHSFGGSGRETVRLIRPTADGGFLIGGNSSSPAGGNKSAAAFGKNDIWLVKIDADGNKLWDQSLGGSEDETLADVKELPESGFVVLGTSSSPVSGNKQSISFGATDFWISRLDENGAKIWDRSFGGAGSDQGFEVRRMDDGGFLVAGTSASQASGNKSSAKISGNYDLWVLRLDSDGKKLWEQGFGQNIPYDSENHLLARIFNISGASMVVAFSEQVRGAYGRLSERISPAGAPAIFVNSALSNSFTLFGSAPIKMVTSFPNGAIFYTLDGSQPGFGSARYGGPITVNKSLTIRAIAYSADFLTSSEAEPVDIAITRTFKVTGATSGGGTVTLDHASGIYASNTVAHITAAASAGWTFLGWTGFTNGTGATLDLIVDGPKSVNGVFGTTLGGTVAGPGSLVFSPNIPMYPYGTNVVITAVPDPGYYLAAWGNAATGTNNPLKFAVRAPTQTVAAAFAAKLNQLIQFAPIGDQLLGGGRIALNATSSSGLPVSYSVVEGAAQVSGNQLSWTAGGKVVVKASQPGNGLYNPAPDSMQSFEIFVTVTATATPGGSVQAAPLLDRYEAGSVVTLTAAAETNYVFSGWSGDFQAGVNPLTLTLTNNVQVVANFSRVFKIETHVIGGGTVLADPLKQFYSAGEQVQFRAVPAAGFVFSNWLSAVTGTNPIALLTVSGDAEVTAVFAALVGGAVPVQVSTLAGNGVAGHLDVVVATEGEMNQPDGPSVGNGGTIYFADVGNDSVRFVGADGSLGTLAGGGRPGNVDGSGTNALFSSPLGVRLLSNGDLLVADSENNVIRWIPDGTSTVRNFAGDGTRGYLDGPSTLAEFAFPNDIAEGTDGSVFVTEFLNHTVRRISADRMVTTVAGMGLAGYVDGPGASARFNQPAGIAADADGNLYVTEWAGHRVRKINAAGVVSTVAGTGEAGYHDGPIGLAQFNNPNGIVAGSNGDLFLTDTQNHVIRRISADGLVTTLAGLGSAGFANGDEAVALFNAPSGIALTPDGSLIVADRGNNRIRGIRFVTTGPRLAMTLTPTLEQATWGVVLSIKGNAGRKAQIESSPDLADWTTLREVTFDAEGKTEVTGLANGTRRFYRAVIGR